MLKIAGAVIFFLAFSLFADIHIEQADLTNRNYAMTKYDYQFLPVRKGHFFAFGSFGLGIPSGDTLAAEHNAFALTAHNFGAIITFRPEHDEWNYNFYFEYFILNSLGIFAGYNSRTIEQHFEDVHLRYQNPPFTGVYMQYSDISTGLQWHIRRNRTRSFFLLGRYHYILDGYICPNAAALDYFNLPPKRENFNGWSWTAGAGVWWFIGPILAGGGISYNRVFLKTDKIIYEDIGNKINISFIDLFLSIGFYM